MFKIGERISVKALHTPCHTQDSICFFMQDGEQRVVFTGDTLFIGGEFLSFLSIRVYGLIRYDRVRPFLRRKCPRDARGIERDSCCIAR